METITKIDFKPFGQAINKHALEERDKRAMKQTLLAAKEEKKIDKIKGMSEEEIDKELAKL